ncbi:MAG TPA: O-antigen ligase domain-containing protein [Anaerolineales bacterium]|nr:O-antigen ligase domain-containing protein [Anaerolineae bacterium]HIQ00721.1 O-antigen ligase domain-containing protein [Anaerolineales bacterium]
MSSLNWLIHLLTSRHRWPAVLVALALTLALAVAGGYLLAEVGPLLAAVGVVGLVAALWMLRDIEVAYWAVIGVVCLLPFASFPFSIGFTPTFLDAALGALFVVWLLQVMTGAQRRFTTTSLGGPVLLFLLLALAAFVLGLGHAPLTSYIVRHFAEILLSVLLFFLVVNTVQEPGRLERLVRVLVVCAFVAALLGVVLYVIPDELTMRALSALRPLGYPTGPGVLRYIRDDPTLPQRATSTSVDPNVLGSLLNIAIGLTVPQLFARQPVIRRVVLVPMLGMMLLCLGLTISRGSFVGVGAALAVIAILRYRNLWWLILAVVLLLLLLPQTQDLVTHFLAGLRGEDLATRMRFGEYRDALILIGRHPILGVGFAGSPDVDTYIGVANVYLLIAEEMGLVGLASFLVVMGLFFARFWRARRAVRADRRLEPIWWGVHAAVIGALVGGLFDHYFFNLDFHHSATLFWLIVGLAAATTEMIEPRDG